MVILVVDNNSADRYFLGEIISECNEEGDELFLAASGEQAISIMMDKAVDILITDIFLPNTSCFDLLEIAKKKIPPIETIVITASNSMETAARLLQEGAFDYFSKPLHKIFIEEKVKKIKDYVKAKRKAALFHLKQEEFKKKVIETIESFNGDYHIMKNVISNIREVLKSNIPDKIKIKKISNEIFYTTK